MSRASHDVVEETGQQTRRELLAIMSDEFEYTASTLLSLLERAPRRACVWPPSAWPTRWDGGVSGQDTARGRARAVSCQ